MDLDQYLDKLDKAIDPEHVARADQLQKDCWDYGPIDHAPYLIGSFDDMSKERSHFLEDWPVFSYGEVFRDPARMLIDELTPAYEGALLKDDKMFTVRPNYGLGTIPSLFGCEVLQEGETYPWVRHFDTIDEVRAVVDQGPPEVEGTMVDRVLSAIEFFREKLAQFENLDKTVHITMCDVQGPLNAATECLGPQIFVELYDHPDVIHSFLDLVTDAYIRLALKMKEALSEDINGGYHFQYRLKGGVRISEDHGLSISPEMYRDFCRPYNERALEPFGGGYILLCGEYMHQLDNILETENLTGLTIWTMNLDDLRKTYEKAKEKKVAILWYGRIPEDELKAFPTGVMTKIRVSTLEEGRELLRKRDSAD